MLERGLWMNNQLICIIGPDGTGKTTQIKLLINNYKEKGIEYKYRWLRFYHFFSLPILIYARIFGYSEVECLENGDKIGYHYFNRSKIISIFYPMFLWLDTFFLVLFKVSIPLLFGEKIISDRFVYDTLIDVMISISDYNFYKSTLGKLFLGLVPKNSQIFLLMSNEESLKSRREDVKNDKNINVKIMLYNKLAEEFNLNVVNVEETINKVHEQIFRGLNE